MRMDPYYYESLVSSLDSSQSTQEQLSSELSSGVRVTSLGTDPVASGENVLMLNQISKDDSFTTTATLTQGKLSVADTSLGSVVDELTKAISLATEGNNGTLNTSEIQDIGEQIQGIYSEVLSLANSTYQGEYIFSGSQTSTAPFTSDGTYTGDSVVNSIETPDGQSIQLNIPGSQIFSSVLSTLSSLVTDFSSGTTSSTSISDAESLSTALSTVSQQRVSLDNSITALSSASTAVTEEETQLTSSQTSLMQADLGTISTQLALEESKQTALINVISSAYNEDLFDKL